MRIAVCISGSLRQFKSCYEPFKKNIIDANNADVDIFVSSWKSKIRHFKKQVNDEGSFDEMLKAYNPVAVNIEVYNDKKRESLYSDSRMAEFQKQMRKHHSCKPSHRKDKCRFCGSNNIHNQIGQLYNIWKANEIKREFEHECNFEYDLVIRTRFDNYFFDSLDDLQAERVSDGSIWIPHGFDDPPEYGEGVNDQFAIGTSEAMNTYANMYPNMYDYCMEYGLSKQGYGVPHRTILVAAEKENIEVKRFWLKYTLMKKFDLYKKRSKGMTEEQYKDLRI
tara:strand:+ start:168 stop:1004 length:837 start_codon:yes stop_codon:yes gene_type:complete